MNKKKYTIIGIAWTSDKKYSGDKFNSPEARKQRKDRTIGYHKFFWDFVEKVTGFSMEYWNKKYFLDARECAMEQLECDHGIHIGEYSWSRRVFHIPIEQTELVKWVLENLPNNPHEVYKKFYIPRELEKSQLQWRREEGLKCAMRLNEMVAKRNDSNGKF